MFFDRAKRTIAVDGQEVRRVAQLLDEIKFVTKRLDHVIWQALGIPPGRAFPGQTFQGGLRSERWVGALLRILIRQFVEGEAAAIDDLQCAGQRFGIAREQPVHLLGRFKIAVGMPLAAIPQLVDGDVVADAGHDILKDASSGLMEEHVIGDDGRHAHRCGEVGQFEQPELARFGRRRKESAM